ncbi:hypothetical protein CHR53_17960 [Neobacillus mesonae]|uniref:Uncharacterized protein n=1 Tax=Neobacillus mesonae TaxID=1193713 RepID=A0A3T0I0W8_9BACI|nr:hypothetical protein [Neobacillus mesonae]AZU62985.1 hypothetical protein CHR53_17960 [Neobacillus mesonae]
MFQLLIDHSDVNTLNALYVSIYLGLVLKYFWAWGVEYTLNNSSSYVKNTKTIHPLFLTKKTNGVHGSIILTRIIKYIRKKACHKDDSEEPISLLPAFKFLT